MLLPSPECNNFDGSAPDKQMMNEDEDEYKGNNYVYNSAEEEEKVEDRHDANQLVSDHEQEEQKGRDPQDLTTEAMSIDQPAIVNQAVSAPQQPVNVDYALDQQPPTPEVHLRGSEIQVVQYLMDFSDKLVEFL